MILVVVPTKMCWLRFGSQELKPFKFEPMLVGS